ncbi:MAG: hypothetical protein ACO1G9_01490 [Bacteroidota bacterium]
MFIGGIILKFVGCLVYWIFKGFKIPLKEIGNIRENGDLLENASDEITLKVIGAVTILVIVILLGEIKCN